MRIVAQRPTDTPSKLRQAHITLRRLYLTSLVVCRVSGAIVEVLRLARYRIVTAWIDSAE